jgi:hypothetical protein
MLMGYTFWETVLITTAGGSTGVTVFFVFSTRILEWNRRRMLQRAEKRRLNGQFEGTRYFTFSNKLMVRVKRRLGVVGMAFLTPTILSIPIGAVVSAKFFKHEVLMIPALIFSVFIWSLGLTSLTYLFE